MKGAPESRQCRSAVPGLLWGRPRTQLSAGLAAPAPGLEGTQWACLRWGFLVSATWDQGSNASLFFFFVVVPLLSCVKTLWPRGLQHAKLLCPLLYLGVCSIHVRWVGDAIQPSHPLSSTSPAFNLSKHQGLFQWVSHSHQVAKSTGASASVLPMKIQDLFPLGLIGLISLQSKGLSRVLSSTTVRRHQLFSAPRSLWSNLTSVHDYWENHSFYWDLSPGHPVKSDVAAHQEAKGHM